MQQVFQRFSGSLQKILEDIDRCMVLLGRLLESRPQLPARCPALFGANVPCKAFLPVLRYF